MDLLSSIRNSGSCGGHRENYLSHSLMAPVGRWQKGKDLNQYVKAESTTNNQQTTEEKCIREHKEEIRRIKEAEEDILSRALGLPIRVIKETEEGDDDIEEMGKGTGFSDFVGKTEGAELLELNTEEQKGGLMKQGRDSGRLDRARDNRDRYEGGRDKKR
ncbi:kinase phosphorylation protein [Rutstroemia sp. NJR-2017a WRK4]|nr:kinase phosphorylation protein [Rutstroemia sp. NJR-2017a WRK4]